MIENQNSKAYFAIYAVRKNGMQHTDSKTPQARRAARTALEESSGDIEASKGTQIKIRIRNAHYAGLSGARAP